RKAALILGVVMFLLYRAYIWHIEGQLISAAMSGDASGVRLALQSGAPAHSREFKGRTAIDWAIYHGHLDVVELLLDKEVSLNQGSEFGSSLLMKATHAGKAEVVGALIARGANVNAKDWRGRTALMYAAEYRHSEIAQILL